MAAIYSNGGNRWNIFGFNFTKRDALSSVYKISMILPPKFLVFKLNHIFSIMPFTGELIKYKSM